MIEASDIADAYLLELIYRKMKAEDKLYAEFRVGEIRRIFVEEFRKLMIDQIKKYVDDERYDPKYIHFNRDFNSFEIREFPALFSHTYRSSSTKTNVVWVKTSEIVHALDTAEGFLPIVHRLDELFHAYHNGGYVIYKIGNSLKLYETIRTKFNSTSTALVKDASRETKLLMDKYEAQQLHTQ